MLKRKLDPPRGGLTRGPFRHVRYHPSDVLDPFVEHYWIVEWDLRGRPPFLQESLPHPSIHIVVQPGRSEVVGVVERKFRRILKGRAGVFGIKFRPGGFYPFVRSSVTHFTNRRVRLTRIFGRSAGPFARALREAREDSRRVEIAEAFLRFHLPAPDATASLARRIVERIAADRNIFSVHQLIGAGMSRRGLQRLFRRYVGTSPKWVIQRYRLHEAIEQIARGKRADWVQLALDLGYYDQSHFIRHFKALVGHSPGEFERKLKGKSRSALRVRE